MEIIIQRFKEEHLHILDKWSEELDWGKFPKNLIPPASFIAKFEDEVIGFGCCYFGEGCSFARMGTFLFDRSKDRKILAQACKQIMGCIFNEALESGRDTLYYTSGNKFFNRCCEEMGMIIAEENVTSYIKDLAGQKNEIEFFTYGFDEQV